MPLLIFFLKTIFGIFLITWAGKFLFWVFSNDTTTEEQDEISWLEEVRARPSLLIKPAIFCIILPIVSYLGIHHIITSQAAWAGEFRSFSIAAWYYLKWPFIVMTWLGINRFLYWLFLEHLQGERWSDTVFHDVYDGYKTPLFTGMQAFFVYRITLGPLCFVIFNFFMLVGIYYQLSPAHRLIIDGLIH